MKQVPLTRGYIALVDDEDYERVMQFKWHPHVSPRTETVYAIANLPKKKGQKHRILKMHRMILGVDDPRTSVDHADRNGLNNQRSNLRPCTMSQNIANSRKRLSATSRFKGVCWDRQKQRWYAYAWDGERKKFLSLGHFTSERAAALRYNEAATRIFGAFARLNVLDG